MRSRTDPTAIASTGGAVALCSLTTSLGYSSLLIAKNRALTLFGVFAVAGEVSCLSTALIVLPAVLYLVVSSRLRPHRHRRSRVAEERAPDMIAPQSAVGHAVTGRGPAP